MSDGGIKRETAVPLYSNNDSCTCTDNKSLKEESEGEDAVKQIKTNVMSVLKPKRISQIDWKTGKCDSPIPLMIYEDPMNWYQHKSSGNLQHIT